MIRTLFRNIVFLVILLFGAIDTCNAQAAFGYFGGYKTVYGINGVVHGYQLGFDFQRKLPHAPLYVSLEAHTSINGFMGLSYLDEVHYVRFVLPLSLKFIKGQVNQIGLGVGIFAAGNVERPNSLIHSAEIQPVALGGRLSIQYARKVTSKISIGVIGVGDFEATPSYIDYDVELEYPLQHYTVRFFIQHKLATR